MCEYADGHGCLDCESGCLDVGPSAAADGYVQSVPLEEKSWLIELEGPKWAGFVDGKPEWTTDPNRALRFARKEDADNFKAFWCMTATSTEHSWS